MGIRKIKEGYVDFRISQNNDVIIAIHDYVILRVVKLDSQNDDMG